MPILLVKTSLFQGNGLGVQRHRNSHNSTQFHSVGISSGFIKYKLLGVRGGGGGEEALNLDREGSRS